MRAFTHARVIDGRGGFIPDGTVVVDGSTIVNVGAASGGGDFGGHRDY